MKKALIIMLNALLSVMLFTGCAEAERSSSDKINKNSVSEEKIKEQEEKIKEQEDFIKEQEEKIKEQEEKIKEQEKNLENKSENKNDLFFSGKYKPDEKLTGHSEDYDGEQLQKLSEVLNGTFYGVFVAAFKDSSDCIETVNKLEDAGFFCMTVYTPDFSGLNPEPYYAVSTEFFSTQQAANEMLEKVKAAGFTDAYVKYAGSYIGNTVDYIMYDSTDIEVLEDSICLSDVYVEIPYRTDTEVIQMDLYVYKDAIFDKTCHMSSFTNYEIGDAPYDWIVRNINNMKNVPDKYDESEMALRGVFEIALNGNKITRYYRCSWWD